MAQTAHTTEVLGSDAVLRAEGAMMAARRERLGQPADRLCLGIGLSGAGTRSGTFNLGILQGLARADLLPCVDYLSTVSGAGYIGTWLHALIKRRAGNPAEIKADLERPDVHPHSESRDPISFLPKFSSYPAPDVGILSAVTRVIAVSWIRNMLLNQRILVPFLACLSLLAFWAACLSHWYGGGVRTLPALVELAIAMGFFAFAAPQSGAAGEMASKQDETLPDRDFLYAPELIQLMENVWSDLRLLDKSHRESPANGGWVTVFVYRTHQPLFKETWKRASYTFNPIFQQFYNTLSESYVPEPSKNTCRRLPWNQGKDRSINK